MLVTAAAAALMAAACGRGADLSPHDRALVKILRDNGLPELASPNLVEWDEDKTVACGNAVVPGPRIASFIVTWKAAGKPDVVLIQPSIDENGGTLDARRLSMATDIVIVRACKARGLSAYKYNSR